MNLTARQQEIYDYIKDYHQKHRYMPTTREIADHFSFNQTAAVHHVKALVAKGRILRPFARARAMVLVDEKEANV